MAKKRELIKTWTKDDFRVDTFRAGGKGGQNQNKRDSGCRITHIESGLSAESREHRDQLTNKKAAFDKLVPLLIEKYFPKSKRATHAPNKEIRTYHEPEDRVTDQFGKRYSYKEVIGKAKASKMINQHVVDSRNKNEGN